MSKKREERDGRASPLASTTPSSSPRALTPPPHSLSFPHLSLNKCGVISPRYDVGHGDIEDWVERLLPSRLFGVIVLTTSAGICSHEEARSKKLGGKVLGFFY